MQMRKKFNYEIYKKEIIVYLTLLLIHLKNLELDTNLLKSCRSFHVFFLFSLSLAVPSSGYIHFAVSAKIRCVNFQQFEIFVRLTPLQVFAFFIFLPFSEELNNFLMFHFR